MLVADASRRTHGVNAYVSGLGPSRRIVVYDTLLRQAPAEEVVSVVAHELAHAKHRDVVTGTLLGAGGAAAAVVGLYLLGGWDGLLRAPESRRWPSRGRWRCWPRSSLSFPSSPLRCRRWSPARSRRAPTPMR